MPQVNVFDNDIFSLQSLTATVNTQPVVPGRIGQLGYFQEQGVSTVAVSVESKAGKLQLVSNKERGDSGNNLERENRKMIAFNTLHLPQTDMIMADEVQGVRAFGSEDMLEAVETVVNNKVDRLRRNLDATTEYHRAGAIQGKVLDSDGTTVLHDIYQSFGITKTTKSIDFSATDFDMRNKGRELRRVSKKALGNVMVPRWRVLCGSAFFDALVADEGTKRAWERYNEGEALRNDPEGGFLFGGLFWEEYADEINDSPLIPEDKAFLVPEGVNGLFITRFAPADYMDTVNTLGLPYYADTQPVGRKGVKLEVQSNPIHLCLNPAAIIELELDTD